MTQYMVKVMNNGLFDYLPIRATTNEQGLQKAKRLYKGVTCLDIIDRQTYRFEQFGVFGNPFVIPMGHTYVKTSKTYKEDDPLTYDIDQLDIV